ncbi:hypothetical protein GCM10010187_57710 [Actinomadura coerulea]|nr:hypothetical protein GCM10010187_57710 [Actinomadura coerulea]
MDRRRAAAYRNEAGVPKPRVTKGTKAHTMPRAVSGVGAGMGDGMGGCGATGGPGYGGRHPGDVRGGRAGPGGGR